MELAGWGRYPRHESDLIALARPEAVSDAMALRSGAIARGNGRAYGDAAIGEDVTLATGGLDRMRSFDPATARLTVEAGVLLADIIATFLPRGYFPPVVPGTKLVTVGGMIAADVHGKNHHRDGGFGAHVEELKLVVPGGATMTCSPTENAEIFTATIGGMGLTGTIVEATFRLKAVETGWLRQHTLVAPNLDAAMAALRASSDATYSVAWIDCLARGRSLGRSLVFVAEHATREETAAVPWAKNPFPAPRRGGPSLPFDCPPWTLNGPAVAAFNELYFRRGAARAGASFLVPWEPYFFPLDGLGRWNRLYGARGFVQHQCVIPTAAAGGAISEILERVSRRGGASFLAVLKQLGPSQGTLSFPLEGYTLALDLRLSDGLLPFLDELDTVVLAAGGRLYLAKDARQSRATFERSYPGLAKFRDLRRALEADGRVASRQSLRLGI